MGRSWVHVFARAGCDTRIFDRDSAQASKALEWIGQSLDRRGGASASLTSQRRGPDFRHFLSDLVKLALRGS